MLMIIEHDIAFCLICLNNWLIYFLFFPSLCILNIDLSLTVLKIQRQST